MRRIYLHLSLVNGDNVCRVTRGGRLYRSQSIVRNVLFWFPNKLGGCSNAAVEGTCASLRIRLCGFLWGKFWGTEIGGLSRAPSAVVMKI